MGKVCRKRQTKQVLQNFFTTGNIKQLRCNLHLAEQQGAQISMVYGTAPAVQIAEYARVSGVAKIVMGRINHKSGAHHGENSPADQLTDLEVYILPNCQHLLRGRLENCVCRKHIFLERCGRHAGFAAAIRRKLDVRSPKQMRTVR